MPGFYKLEDTNGDDVMDRIERINGYAAAGMGDHGPHAIRRGPDGSIMFLIGNNTYVGSRSADGQVNDAAVDTESSPNWNNVEERQFLPQFNDPRFGNSTRIGVHSTVWRLQPNNKYSLFFSGMRNPYDFAFNLAGEAFTFDSDMEWDVNAPWYREVRTVHMIPGGDAGYRNGTGKFQDEYFDTIPALRHLRRGSPVGVEFYQSYAYPEKFFDNLFEADWSRGRLLYTALTPSGATYTGREDLAEFVHGEPMPITDLEVGPDGNIYLTTGGAAGQGGLYKVSWTGAKPAQPDMTGILAVVRQPQPLSSWAWDAIEKVKASMGASFGAELEKLARSATASPRDRSRALLEMQRHGAAPNAALLQALLKDRQADVRAAAAYVAGLHSSDAAKAVAAAALKDTSALVQRRGAEALVRQGMKASAPPFAPIGDIYALLQEPRSVRPLLGPRGARTHAQGSVGQARDGGNQRGRVDRGSARDREHHSRGAVAVGAASGLREAPDADAADDADRRTRRSGCCARSRWPWRSRLRASIPRSRSRSTPRSSNSCRARRRQAPGCRARTRPGPQAQCSQFLLAHHLAKVLAYTGEPDVVGRILAIVPKGDEDQPGQIDLMYSLRVIDTGWTQQQKQQAIDWFAKASRWRGGSTFAGHVNTIFDATIDAFTADEKQMAYKAAPLFAPITEDMAAARRSGWPRGAAAAAAAGRRCRSTARSASTISSSRAAAARVRSPAAAALPTRRRAAACSAKPARSATATAPSARTTRRISPASPSACSGATSCARSSSRTRRSIRSTRRRVLALKDGKTVRGLVVSETGQNVVVKTAEEPEPVTVAKNQIAKRTTEAKTIMPDDIADKVTDAGVRDVTAYIMQMVK